MSELVLGSELYYFALCCDLLCMNACKNTLLSFHQS